MADHHFISYSTADAQEFALWLLDALADQPIPITAWVDTRCLKPGADWDVQILDAIQRCRTLLFVMSPDSVEDLSICKTEWSRALKYKKPIVPLLLCHEVEPPFRLQDRQYIDFAGERENALRRLCEHLAWLETPTGRLQEYHNLLLNAEREMRRNTEGLTAIRIQDDIAEYKRQIAHYEGIADDPKGAALRVEESIARGIELERRPKEPVSGVRKSRFINPPPGIAPRYFQDREVETRLVVDFLSDDAKRVMTIVGRGGIGKTATVCRLLKTLESGLLPDEEGEFHVDGVVYLSATGSHPISMPNLFNDLCKLLPDQVSSELTQVFKEPAASTRAKMVALLDAFPAGRTVVLLDNFENLIASDTGKLHDVELLECLAALLTVPAHGVKVIITTRIVPRDFALLAPGCQSRIDLDKGLPEPFAENILRAMDVDGKVGLRDAPVELLGQARERTRGFPRALEALFAILSADRDTELEEILRDTVKLLPENVVEALVGEAFNRLDRTAQQVMQALSMYNRPVAPVAVDFLLAPYLPGVDSGPTLSRLLNMQFVHKEQGRYYLHPLDSAYALGLVEIGAPSDCIGGGAPRFSLYALRHRGAEFFRQARKPRANWKSFEDLNPQLAEFDLRCQNGDYETAFRVIREVDFDYLLIWGYYRQMADMHLRLEGKLPAHLQGSSLNGLGLALENLGSYEEALKNYEGAVRIAQEEGDRDSVAIYLSNMAICHVRLGETLQAIDCNRRGLDILRQNGSSSLKISHLNNLANRYADLGDNVESLRLFEEALPIAREVKNAYAAAANLESCGHVLVAMGRLEEAEVRYREALDIADEINSIQVRNYAHWGLATVALFRGEFAIARREAEIAAQYPVPDNDHHVLLLLGIVCLRQGEMSDASGFLNEAISRCDIMLEMTPRNYAAMDTKALAGCGLILSGKDFPLATAIEILNAARAINRDPGVISRLLLLFDAMVKAEGGDRIVAARKAAVDHR